MSLLVEATSPDAIPWRAERAVFTSCGAVTCGLLGMSVLQPPHDLQARQGRWQRPRALARPGTGPYPKVTVSSSSPGFLRGTGKLQNEALAQRATEREMERQMRPDSVSPDSAGPEAGPSPHLPTVSRPVSFGFVVIVYIYFV